MKPEDMIQFLNDEVLGIMLMILILGIGIYLTIRTRFVQVRCLGKALRYMIKNENDGVGEVTSFGALCTALSATIGTGNIVGVATAICAGGPGALLWMLIAAFFGMATKYTEGLLAIKFRRETRPGHFLGGPFYYIELGLGKKWRWLSKAFAFFGALAGIMGIGTITQINGITSSATSLFDPEQSAVAFSIGGVDYTWTTVIAGAAVTALAALVIIGGIKRIAKVSEIIVPFMAAAYVLFALIILIANYQAIPAAIKSVVVGAFDPSAVGGAITGLALKTVIQKGVGRGIFSNEAGLGSAPIAAASAKTNSPARQGLVTMTGTFIDTIVICTMTGLSIVITGSWDPRVTGGQLQGVNVTTYAWQHGLPFDKDVSAFILMMCLVFFAFTTILGWNYYGERCLEYLSGGKKSMVLLYRCAYILAVLIGPYLTVAAVWNIADVFNSLMAFPNLVALFLLAGIAAKETKRFRQENKRPQGRKGKKSLRR